MKKPSKKPWYENLESENRVDYFSIIQNLLGADIECECAECTLQNDTKTTPKAKSKPKTSKTKVQTKGN